MNQDDIFQTGKFVIQALEALKNEYGKILGNLVHSPKNFSLDKIEEKISLVRESMDTIDLGLSIKIAFFFL